jgi:PAS domain S-box-containing protein
LLESEARMGAILAAVVDAIIIIDEYGAIESLNGAAERLFGYAAVEMIGKNVKMLMLAPYRTEHVVVHVSLFYRHAQIHEIPKMLCYGLIFRGALTTIIPALSRCENSHLKSMS